MDDIEMSESHRRDSVISSDSSFYGDEALRKELIQQQTTSITDLVALLEAKNLTRMAEKSRKDNERSTNKEPFNQYKNVKSAWQFDEDIDEFLNQLPPSTSLETEHGPWIRVANPQSDITASTVDVSALKEGGQAILKDWEARKKQVKGKALKDAVGEVSSQILKFATTVGETSGKWMLFPSPAHVDEVWSIVAKATVKGDLGIATKVATAREGDIGSCLICVYTKDFGNVPDIKRVCMKLIALDLVDKKRPIYYKCDVYTYLEIDSKNKWGLKASLFSSADILNTK